jgi:hypothetical protein
MLFMANWNLKEHKVKAYQRWIKENEKALAEHAPKGWKFLGAYFYVLGFGPYTAATLWEITDYADLDALRNHDDPVWLKLSEESMTYGTPEPTPNWLLREAGDTKITEPKEEP